jgi:4-hydroxy-3-methylbut-2-enyl diphosphate reductase
MMVTLKRVVLAKPRGFCAGVVRAIETVKRAIELFRPPVYVCKHIVHNKHVVEELRSMGAVFVQSLDEVPDGTVVIFSAHGVPPAVREHAKRKSLKVIDATCPLVQKVHAEAKRYAVKGYSIVLFGHKGHDEVEGIVGEAPEQIVVISDVGEVEGLQLPNPERVVCLTQTTVSIDAANAVIEALKNRFPNLELPLSKGICYATQNRQTAVKLLSKICDGIIVIGSAYSSNARRLCEVATGAGVPAILIGDADELQPQYLQGMEVIGITASASTPEAIVVKVVERLCEMSTTDVAVEEIEFVKEDMHFSLPKLPPQRHL